MSQSSREMILPVLAFIISLIALGGALWEGKENREFRRLSLMPVVELDWGTSANSFRMTVNNSGTGPAVAKWMSVYIDGKEVASWDDIASIADTKYSFSIVWPNTIIRPTDIKDSRELFAVSDAKAASALLKNINRINIEICYCSVYDYCKIVNLRGANIANACNKTTKFGMPPSFLKL